MSSPTEGPWRYKVELGDINGKFKHQCRRFIIESPTRAAMFVGEAWKFSDDQAVFEEVEANFKLAVGSHGLLAACRAALQMLQPCNPQDPALQGLGECPAGHPNECGACATRHLIERAITNATLI